MAPDSTPKQRSRKRSDRPQQPYPEFPLQPHGSGQWSKRVRGQLHYFGKWGQRKNGKLTVLPDGGAWRAALNRFRAEIDDLQAGRKPRPRLSAEGGLVVADLCNNFLTSKTRNVQAKELSIRTLSEYKEATDLIVEEFGRQRLVNDLIPQDFEALRAKMAESWGPSRLGKFIQMTRSVFKYGADNGLCSSPMYGSLFKKPSKAVLRRHNAKRREKVFEAATIRTMLSALDGKEVVSKSDRPIKIATNPQLKAMILLAINAGLGNTDVANLQLSDIGSDGWLHYPRPKTGVDRRVPLWPESLAALEIHLKRRRTAKSKDDQNCVFLNRAGRRMVQVHSNPAGHPDVALWTQDYVSSQFRSLLRSLKLGAKGMGFYSLRHTFATIALETGDRDAVKSIMGHIGSDILTVYDATGPSDKRLKNVVNSVRKWLYYS